jgi:hypothetical protein
VAGASLLLRKGRLQKAAIVAAATMEETMRVLTIVELFLTKIELCNLAAKVANDIPMLLEGTQQRANALTSLRNIRFVLARRHFTP